MSCFFAEMCFLGKNFNCEYFSIFLPFLGKTTKTQCAYIVSKDKHQGHVDSETEGLPMDEPTDNWDPI
jgi:hypothetical protein